IQRSFNTHIHIYSHVFFLIPPPLPRSTLFPYTTLFRSRGIPASRHCTACAASWVPTPQKAGSPGRSSLAISKQRTQLMASLLARSEEHTSELQSLRHLVCRLLLEKKNKNHQRITSTVNP